MSEAVVLSHRQSGRITTGGFWCVWLGVVEMSCYAVRMFM